MLPAILQHTAFMAVTLLSEVNSVCRLASKLLGMATAPTSSAGTATAAGRAGPVAAVAAMLAAADRATFVLFR